MKFISMVMGTARAGGLGGDPADLVVVAVDGGDPGAGVPERGLAAELTNHLECDKGDPAGRADPPGSCPVVGIRS